VGVLSISNASKNSTITGTNFNQISEQRISKKKKKKKTVQQLYKSVFQAMTLRLNISRGSQKFIGK
jgi:hypothetical protein